MALELRLAAATAGGGDAAGRRTRRPRLAGADARGLLVAGAAEVATLAGGLRRGAAQDDPAIAPPGTAVGVPGRPDRRGRARGRGRARRWRQRWRPTGASPDAFDRRRRGRRHDHARPDRRAHPPAVRRHARGRGRGCAQRGADLPGDPRGRRRHPLDGARRRAPPPTTSCSPTAGAGSGEMLRHGDHHRRGEVGLRPGPATELRLLASPVGWPPRARRRRSPRSWAPTRSRRRSGGSRRTRRGDRGVRRPRSSSEQLPVVAAQGIARSCDVFCEEGVFSADQARRDPAGRPRPGPAASASTPTSSLPSGGAELAAELGALSADHLGCPVAGGDRWRSAGRRPGRAPGRRRAPADGPLVPRAAPDEPARELIIAGIPVAIATDFNPGTSPVPNLPLVMTVAHALRCGLDAVRGAGRGDGERGQRRSGSGIGAPRAGTAGRPRRLATCRRTSAPVLGGRDLVRAVVVAAAGCGAPAGRLEQRARPISAGRRQAPRDSWRTWPRASSRPWSSPRGCCSA